MRARSALSLLIFLCLGISPNSFAQEDWQKLLAESDSGAGRETVIATFKTTRIINAQSIETVKERTLDFRVAHRFGPMGSAGASGHNLYGFDISSDIRIAFEYGITDALTLGFSRSKLHENLEGLVKLRLLQQTKDNKTPVSVTFFGQAAFSPEKDIDSSYQQWEHRLSYTSQLLIARKFGPLVSLQLMPTWVHRNYVRDYQDANGLFILGAGGRVKFSKRFAFIFDYFYTFNAYRNGSDPYYDPLGAGVEIETGGHVFSIMFTNSAGIIESEFLPHTTDTWTNGGIRFSFNISRNFRL